MGRTITGYIPIRASARYSDAHTEREIAMKPPYPVALHTTTTTAAISAALALAILTGCSSNKASEAPRVDTHGTVNSPTSTVAPQPTSETLTPSPTPPATPPPPAVDSGPATPEPAVPPQVKPKPAAPTLNMPGFEPRAGY